MAEKLNYPGLSGLRKTLDDASEALAGFIKATKRGKVPTKLLMEAADKAVEELAEWRARIKEAVEVPERRDEDTGLH